jgi:hypothetical protein
MRHDGNQTGPLLGVNNCSILVINRRNHGKPCVQQGGGTFTILLLNISEELSFEAFTKGEWMFSVDHSKPNTTRNMDCSVNQSIIQCSVNV